MLFLYLCEANINFLFLFLFLQFNDVVLVKYETRPYVFEKVVKLWRVELYFSHPFICRKLAL
jgi:hypothetical protein